MPSPLDILGGLGQIGGLGALGVYQGEIEGKKLQKDFETRDLENQMRQIELAMRRQRQAEPLGFGPGTLVVDPTTGRPMFQVPFAPQHPLSVGPGHTLIDPVSGRTILSTPPAPQRPVALAPGGTLVDPTTGKTVATGEPKSERPESETQFWATIGEKVASGTATPVEQALWDRHQKAVGATGSRPVSVAPGRALVDPSTGKVVYQAPAAQPKEQTTTTEGWKITPRKLLSDQETATLNASMPQIVNELSMKPGFNVPGAYVTLPNGMKIRKEELLARYVKDRLGFEVSLRWDGSKFVVVKAWNPATRERVESVRRTGPPRSAPAESDEED